MIRKVRSLILFLSTLFRKAQKEDIFASSAQLSYYLILSFCPLLIFITTIINYVNLDLASILETLSIIVPENVYGFICLSLNEMVNVDYGKFLGVSLILVGWSASAGFRGIIKAVNKAFNIKEKRPLIKTCAISILCTFSLGLVIIVALLLLVFWETIEIWLIDLIGMQEIAINVLNSIRYVIIIVVMVIVFSVLYRFLPSINISWANTFPGAITSTLGWIITSMCYSYYLSNFSNYSTLYGSLGVIFSLVIWINITSFVFILGIEVNSVLLKVQEFDIIK